MIQNENNQDENQVKPETQVKEKASLKYADLISQSEQEILLEEKELRVEEAKSNVSLAIAETNLALAKAKQSLNASKRAVPYDLLNEIAFAKEVEELEAGLKYAKKVLKERF